MITNYDSEFERKRKDFEKGIISIYDLSFEEIEKLTVYYKDEIDSNTKYIEEVKHNIKKIKKKIDNIV